MIARKIMFASELVPNLAAKPSCIFVPLVQIDEIFQLFCKTFVTSQRVVSFTFKIVQILVQSHFELVSSALALDATETVSEPVGS